MRRGKVCARDLNMGPGSCAYWWDTCPADVRHCLMRFVRENSAIAGDPDAEEASLKRWEAERAKELEPAPKML